MSNNDELTLVSLHSIGNLLGNDLQLSLFSDRVFEISKRNNSVLSGTIDRFGVDLTDFELRVLMGILRGFSETGYQGNISPSSPSQVAQEKFSGNIPDSYKHIKEIPRVRCSQADIFRWAEINTNSIADCSRAVEALNSISAKQWCFYYDRLSFEEDGRPILDSNGAQVSEEVYQIDTLISLKKVINKDSGYLQYYEIMPSAIFLDQKESYFMLIPYDWREEVKKVMGSKKASSYTFRFLLYLRYQVELSLREGSENPFTIKKSPEEMAIAIKMPPSIYNKNKKRRDMILENAYEVAERLDYLNSHSREGYLDILKLNPKKYNPSQNLKPAIDYWS